MSKSAYLLTREATPSQVKYSGFKRDSYITSKIANCTMLVKPFTHIKGTCRQNCGDLLLAIII